MLIERRVSTSRFCNLRLSFSKFGIICAVDLGHKVLQLLFQSFHGFFTLRSLLVILSFVSIMGPFLCFSLI